MQIFQTRYPSARSLLSCAFTVLVGIMLMGAAPAEQPKQKTFDTPKAAVEAMVKALRDKNEKELYAIFGPGSEAVLSSGDRVDDSDIREEFLNRYAEKSRLEAVGEDRFILYLGKNSWWFPIPIVKADKSWRFDTEEGKEEIINRRIGRNELDAIQTCLAVVDAQVEYAASDRDGDGLREYAQKFHSTKGKTDGLYWETGKGQKPSPLGPLMAKARSEGYEKGEKPEPYNGYIFKLLTSQGRDARGGSYEYVVKGNMIGGFAVLAFPASYGVSGIKSFIVNYDGVVFEKDLGPKTENTAASMKVFNPDKTWQKAEEAGNISKK